LASLLKPFGIRPKDLRMGEGKSKGYEKEAFSDAWTRYLAPDPRQGRQPTNGAENASNSIRDKEVSVADGESSGKPRPACVLALVADQEPVPDENQSPAPYAKGHIPGPERCHACRGWRFWQRSPGGPPVCAKCHPPPSHALVSSWLGGDDTQPT